MQVEDFVIKLGMLAPRRQDLEEKQLPLSFIDDYIGSFRCLKKDKINIREYTNNTLLELLNIYDCTKVQVGIVSFIYFPVEKADYFKVGFAEQDILILNKITLGVEIRDFGDNTFVLWKCAANANAFLESLLHCVEFFNALLEDESLINNQTFIHNSVLNCCETAGGEQYLNFYKMLMGDFT
jgi:hypothetical protein